MNYIASDVGATVIEATGNIGMMMKNTVPMPASQLHASFSGDYNGKSGGIQFHQSHSME